MSHCTSSLHEVGQCDLRVHAPRHSSLNRHRSRCRSSRRQKAMCSHTRHHCGMTRCRPNLLHLKQNVGVSERHTRGEVCPRPTPDSNDSFESEVSKEGYSQKEMLAEVCSEASGVGKSAAGGDVEMPMSCCLCNIYWNRMVATMVNEHLPTDSSRLLNLKDS